MLQQGIKKCTKMAIVKKVSKKYIFFIQQLPCLFLQCNSFKGHERPIWQCPNGVQQAHVVSDVDHAASRFPCASYVNLFLKHPDTTAATYRKKLQNICNIQIKHLQYTYENT
jgi:hypothetical protein